MLVFFSTGFPETLRLLLAKEGLNLEKTSRQLNALHWAAEGGNALCIRQLLQHGMQPNATTAKSYCKLEFIVAGGVTPLMLASKGGHASAIKELLHFGAQVDLFDDEGMTALTYAAKYNHGACIEALVRGGADPDGRVRSSDLTSISLGGMAPLLLATERANLNAVRSLLRANADVHALGFGSWHQQGPLTAFEMALLQRHMDVCRMLLAAGYNISTVNPSVLDEALAQLLQSDEESFHWLSAAVRAPPSLLQLCRCTIRSTMGRRALDRVAELPLPLPLLQLCDLQDLVQYDHQMLMPQQVAYDEDEDWGPE